MQNQPTKKIVLIVLILILILILFLWFFLQKKTGNASSPATQVTTFETQEVYPGASFSLPIEIRAGLTAKADNGTVYSISDGSALVYVAPLTGNNDNYTLMDGHSGIVLAQGSVLIPLTASAELEVLELSENSVSASYGAVSILAELSAETATVTYSEPESDTRLKIQINADDTANLEFNGLEFDGYGALTTEESSALHLLATGPLARALTMVPLDLGCKTQAENIPDQLFAAILMAWQMILKYEVAIRGPVISHFFEQSSCSFPHSPLGSSEKPENKSIIWDQDHVIPQSYFFFPFDGAGQKEVIEP